MPGLRRLQSAARRWRPRWHDPANPAQMAASGIDRPGARRDQKRAPAKHHRRALRLCASHRGEAHRRPLRRLADIRGISRRSRPGAPISPPPKWPLPPLAGIAATQDGSWLRNAGPCARRNLLRKTARPAPSAPCAWDTFFARSRPTATPSDMTARLCGFSPVHLGTPMPRGAAVTSSKPLPQASLTHLGGTAQWRFTACASRPVRLALLAGPLRMAGPRAMRGRRVRITARCVTGPLPKARCRHAPRRPAPPSPCRRTPPAPASHAAPAALRTRRACGPDRRRPVAAPSARHW